MMSSDTDSDRHVAVLAFPFASHPSPVLSITRRLASAAPNTTFSFFSTAKSNASLFSTPQPSNIKPFNVSDGIPEGYALKGKSIEDIIELFMEKAHDNFKKGMEVAVKETGRKVSCLVTDAFLWFGKELAEEFGVANWIPFFLSGGSPLSTHIYTDLIREHFQVGGGIGGREDETLDFIPGMSKVHIHDLPEGIVSGNLESNFSRMVHQMGRVLPEATAVFINSFEELEPVITKDMKSKLKRFLHIGPLILSTPPPPVPDPHGCLSWLDNRKVETVAYVSFGSVVTPPPHELVAIAEALEASKVPFIWSLKDDAKVHLPHGFVDRVDGIMVPWAPQMDVLAHEAVGVFIGHGGYNSMTESIAIGKVPMIVRPFFGDHGLNVRMIQDVWEIGVIAKTLTKDGLLSCLEQVLAQEKGKKMRENLKALKEAAQRAVGPEGSSTKNFKALLDLVSS